MSALGALGNLGKVYQGFQAEEANTADIRARQLKLQQAQTDQLSQQFLGNTLAGLQEGVKSLAVPGTATPVQAPPPGAASIPSPSNQQTDGTPSPAVAGALQNIQASGGMPGAGEQGTPGTFRGGNVPGNMPAAAGPPPPVQSPPTGQPGPTAPTQPQQPAAQVQPGQMTTQQLAQMIMKANPKVDWSKPQNQIALLGAVDKQQALLAPQAKAELAEAKMALEKQKAQQTYDAKIQDIQRKSDDAIQKAQTAQQVAEIRASASQQVAAIAAAARTQGITIQVDSRERVAGNAEAGKDRRLGLTLDNKTAVAAAHDEVKKELGDAKNLNDTKKIEGTQWYQKRMTELKEQGLSDAATKAQLQHETQLIQEEGKNTRAGNALTEKGREFDISDATKRATSEAKLKSLTDKAKSSGLTDDEVAFYVKALRTDPAMVQRMMGGGALGTQAKQQIAKAFANDPQSTPESIAQAEAVMAGNKAALQTAGRQGAKVDIGAEEIKTFGSQVVSAAKSANLSKYPTWNALQQAITNRTGGPEVVALNDAITNYRNALIQVAQRGGATSEGAQARADQYLNGKMSLPQILAAIQSGKAEAEVAQKAVGTVKQNIVGGIGGSSDKPSGGTASPDDPLGILK